MFTFLQAKLQSNVSMSDNSLGTSTPQVILGVFKFSSHDFSVLKKKAFPPPFIPSYVPHGSQGLLEM
jgi:hypothetical protein